MNFFYNVSKTKSKNIINVRLTVTHTLSFHLLIFWDPMVENIIYEGSGASIITIELLEPPRHSPS